MSQLAARVARYVTRLELLASGDAVVVAVSGGADSLCLLHVLRELAPGLDLRLHVAHLNHGLRGAEADADASFVAELAAGWGMPVTVQSRDVQGYAAQHRLALEEAGRQVRYAFLAETAAEMGASHIALAHHADDQAETVLMHFLRGSGAAGLRGMLPAMPLTDYRALSARAGLTGDLLLVRPLLAESRSEIEAYCAEHGLAPRVDSTNDDVRIYRNRLRHELFPILRTYNPRIEEVLAHTADVMAGDYAVLQRDAETALADVLAPAESSAVAVALGLHAWRSLPIGLQRATIRMAVAQLRRTLRNINWDHIEHAVRVGRAGATGDRATIAAGLALIVDYDLLRIQSEAASAPVSTPQVHGLIRLAVPGVTLLDGGWRVSVQGFDRAGLPVDFAANPDGWTAYLDERAVGRTLYVRPRAPGDRFRPLGLRGHSARVNEYMINAKTPAAARAGWPLLVTAAADGEERVAWVCGLRMDERAAVRADTAAAWQVRFERWVE